MSSVVWVGEQGDNALSFYRQLVPGEALRRAGWEVRYAPVLMDTDDGRLTGLRPGFPPAPVPDVIVTRHLVDPSGRAEQDSVEVIHRARARGQRVFYDLDDNVWDLPEENPARAFYTPDQLEILEANIRACDGVLVSTRRLAEAVRRRTSAPVWVAPNGILVEPFAAAAAAREPLAGRPMRLGWLGLMDFRAADFTEFVDEIAEGLAGWNVELWHLGAHPARASIREVLPAEFPVPVVEHPWAEFSGLPASLARVDAAIVPMRQIPLNWSRSPTTGLALAASGVPFAASATPAYLALAETLPGLSIVEHRADAWTFAIDDLLDATAAGTAVSGDVMRRAVAASHGPAVVAAAWARAFGARLAMAP